MDDLVVFLDLLEELFLALWLGSLVIMEVGGWEFGVGWEVELGFEGEEVFDLKVAELDG